MLQIPAATWNIHHKYNQGGRLYQKLGFYLVSPTTLSQTWLQCKSFFCATWQDCVTGWIMYVLHNMYYVYECPISVIKQVFGFSTESPIHTDIIKTRMTWCATFLRERESSSVFVHSATCSSAFDTSSVLCPPLFLTVWQFMAHVEFSVKNEEGKVS